MGSALLRHFLMLLAFLLMTAPPVVRAQDALTAFPHSDLSSPRATLSSFRSSATAAGRLTLEAYKLRVAEGGFFASDRVRAMERRTEFLLNAAARTMDLSSIPPAVMEHEKVELVLQLKEILDRIPLPDAAEIPDVSDVQAADAAGRPLVHWRISGTELVMVRLDEGPRTGDFVFSSGTVERIPELYSASVSLPSTGGGEDIYEFYRRSPGQILPPIWYEIIRGGPDWLNKEIAGQTLWQWLALAVWTALSVGVLLLLIRRRWAYPAGDEEPGTHVMRGAFLPLALSVLAALFLFVIIDQINLTDTAYLVADAVGQMLLAIGVAWLIVLACQALAETIIGSPSILPGSLDAHLLRAGSRVLGLAFAIILLSHTASQIGVPLLGVLAGLGVGGLAIALAAQPTIENFIGGVILFADRPVRMGDFCSCGDVMGTVEEIGIRSTRIRALDRTVISIPNSEFAKARIVNFSRRDYHLFETTVDIQVDTNTAVLARLLAQLQERFENHPLVMQETIRVRFSQIQNGSLEIELRAYLRTVDYEAFLREKEELLLSVLNIVEQTGCALALPARAVYLARDSARRPKPRAEESHDGNEGAMATGV